MTTTPQPPPKTRLQAMVTGSIWDGQLNSEVPERFRSIYTVLLPLNYGLFVIYGLAGTLARVPSIVKVAGVGFGDAWTVLIGIAGLAALAGLVFRLPLAEFLGTFFVELFMLAYVGSLIFLTIQGDLDRLALSIGVLIFLLFPAWRLVDIARVERRRRHGR